ncbi:hypothetical protein DPMN_020665 [Dreissena polymorpha]|uniref:Uncharacterized protein n=1 Tax=Dreissena polymorpha TaxID=45954 RepID=A0A9D4SAF0_DREPO|nr:hypothetical protein DPMN_020665 [Dreissena polymorpha]
MIRPSFANEVRTTLTDGRTDRRTDGRTDAGYTIIRPVIDGRETGIHYNDKNDDFLKTFWLVAPMPMLAVPFTALVEHYGYFAPRRNKHYPQLRHGKIIRTRRPNRVFTRRIATALGIVPRNDAEPVSTSRTFVE